MSRSPIAYRDRALPRDLVALLIALLLHLSPVALGLLPALALRLLPKPPIEIEILPPKPKPRPAPAEAVATPPPPATPRPQKGPGPGPPNKPAPPSPSVQKVELAKGRLTGLGPSAIDQDLGVRVLLRMPAIRQSPHRATVEALLHAFPDTHILAAGTKYAMPIVPLGSRPAPDSSGLGPPPSGPMARALIDDVDALLIETADPQDISSTVFYAMPRDGTTLGAALSERHSPRWDTRTLHVLSNGLLAFCRADLLGPAPPPATPPGQPPATPPAAAPSLEPEWTDKLSAALRSSGPAVYVEVQNVQQRFRLRSGLPTPVAIRLALSSDADPEVHARVELSTPEEAKLVLDTLPGLQRDISSRLFWLGLGGLLGGLKFQGRGSAVEISGRFPRGDMSVALTWIRQFLPPPDRFLDPPPPPPPAPPDLGSEGDDGPVPAIDGGR